MYDRRAFLARLAAALAAAAAAPALDARTAFARPAPGIDRIGIQLYTVRTAMARDFDGTLARLAEMGYDEVELAGYFGRSPADVRRAVASAGLAAPAAHVDFARVRDEPGRLADEAAEAGHAWVVCPWIPASERSADGYRRLADTFDRAGAEAAAVGLRFAYHNHDFEFAPLPGGGGLPFERLLTGTDPALVDFELDLYWAARAGHDPLVWIERHPGRFPMVHVKDMDDSSERRMVDPGQGVIDFAAVIAARHTAGIRHWFIEHDNPADPFETARTGLAHMRKLAGA